MRFRLVVPILVAASVAATAPARADETTFCNTYITSLPYTITVQGHYCFNRNLSTGITSGAAITIAADYVLLDLNNFKLGGGGAGPATDAIGIHAVNRGNLVIRGGNIRGFAHGIVVEGATNASAKNVTIEDNVVDGNLKTGINAYGQAMVVRRNFVTQTGGSTSPNQYCPFDGGRTEGITVRPVNCSTLGSDAFIHDNTVVRTGVNDATYVIGIFGTAGAGIVRGNTVISLLDNGGGKAITGTVCRDNSVLGVSTGTADGYQCTYLVGTNSVH